MSRFRDNGKASCSLCSGTIAAPKDDTTDYSIYAVPNSQGSDEHRIQKCCTLNLITADFLRKIKNENESASTRSFPIARLLAEQEKMFTGGELIKSCLIVAAEKKKMCPEKINLTLLAFQ